jgi:glycosyltransferase involved in cell wall biosynthesis
VAQRARKIIAVSEFTKNDIIKLLKVSADKIKVVYEGVDLPKVPSLDANQTLLNLGIKGNFIMYVGSAYPHKNLEKLAEAFALDHKENPDIQLVLAGRLNFFYQRLKDSIKAQIDSGEVVLTDYLSDEQLAILYAHAKAYVFPSLIEGFGLPPLEAQSYGLPVVSSNRSCLPEVLGEGAVYFNPEDIREMADKINSVLHDESLRQKLIVSGHENLKKYSWQKMAEEISNAYRGF